MTAAAERLRATYMMSYRSEIAWGLVGFDALALALALASALALALCLRFLLLCCCSARPASYIYTQNFGAAAIPDCGSDGDCDASVDLINSFFENSTKLFVTLPLCVKNENNKNISNKQHSAKRRSRERNMRQKQ